MNDSVTDRYRVDKLDRVTCIYDVQLDRYCTLPRPDRVHEILTYPTPAEAYAWLADMGEPPVSV